MRKYIFLAVGILMALYAHSQTVQTWTEDFESTLFFNATPTSSWVSNAIYYAPGASAVNPKSCLGLVPTNPGDSTILQTLIYDCTSYDYVILRFSHICKVSPSDIARIEYRVDMGAAMGTWQSLPISAYMGNSLYTYSSVFNAESYAAWKVDDSLALPTQSWWKEEVFDLTEIAKSTQVQFRFVIKHGAYQGTQVSYGWLLDNFQLSAASHELYFPVVQFIYPYIKNTIYSAEPQTIKAKVKTSTNASLQTPQLKYTAFLNGVLTESDSIVMTKYSGDTLWTATIKEFVAGTEVTYSITGQDSLGNFATAMSGYKIALGNKEVFILQDGNTGRFFYPFAHTSGYSRSMALYTAEEIESAVGLITTLALRVETAGSGGFPIKVWLKTVPALKTQWNALTDNLDWSVLTQDALLVYDDNFHFANTGWYDIRLDTFFYYNGTDNLVVMFEQNCDGMSCNSYMSTYSMYHVSSSQTNRLWYKISNNYPPIAATTLSTEAYRPDLRIEIVNSANVHSAATHSIDIDDTLFVSPNTSYPIVATIRNKGLFDLDSVRAFYSINGATPIDKNISFTPALPWDFTFQDTLDYYIPKLNDNDTIKIWVSLPNGQVDTVTYDDTLTKIIYGSSDIVMRFIDYPEDTVYNTGPFEVKTEIYSHSGASIGASLLVTSVSNGTPVYDTLPMGNRLGNTWTATIPQKVFGSDVSYSIELTDILSNQLMIENGYHIKRSDPVVGIDYDNSAAMVAIYSPDGIKGVLAEVLTPVQIVIRNKGVLKLDSCIIHWTVNEQPQTPYYYYGALPEEFTDTMTIGYYFPTLGKRDTLVVWVDMPNGEVDPITNDDTLKSAPLGCAAIFAGNVRVGAGENFTSINDVLEIIRNCGVGGDVTMELKGTFAENINLTGFADYMGGYSLTITSIDNHPDSAIIRPNSGIGITLSNMHNLILRAITVNATAGTNAIQFTGACTNIVVRDCKLLANPTTTSTAYNPIYKANGTGSVDSIFIINNLLDGGYSGFNFYGGANENNRGTNVVFDSNTVSNQYYYGTWTYYMDFTSCSYNTILSRTANATGVWRALYMFYCNGHVVGNRILQRTTVISQPSGIGLSYYHTHPGGQNKGIVANNEIIIYAAGTYYGIRTENAKAEIVHNSIYVTGSGAARGIEIYNTTSNDLLIKNNNIVMTSAAAFPVYFNSVNNLNLYNLDYNNMYAPQYVGYFGGNRATIADWQQAITTDLHSVSILPDFIEPVTNLDFKTAVGFVCDTVVSVYEDIEKTPRTGVTTMGCYEKLPPIYANLNLVKLLGTRSGYVLFQTDTLKVVLSNMGSTPLSSVNLEWSVNGVSQTTGGVDFPVSLLRGASDTITLGTITYSGGNTEVIVWVNHLNGGTTTDENAQDDTLKRAFLVCSGGYSGLITIGASSTNNFETIGQAYEALSLCGASGDITFVLESGVYTESINFTSNSIPMGNHTLTVTSATGNADHVIIRPPSGVGILLSNSNNIVLKAITVDVAANGTNAIQFSGQCLNIVVRGCKLLANQTTSSSACNPVYKTNGTGMVDSIFFINNLLDGGYSGFHFYGPSTTVFGTNIVFDSNTITNSYYYGINTWYIAFASCSYNTISSRTANVNANYWTGISLYYSNGPVVGNKIIQYSDAITQPCGILLQYHNYNLTQDRGLIANNEIMLTMTSAYYGISIVASKSEIIHNSIYISGTGAARGIYIQMSPYNNIQVKNNNIVLTSPTAHPVYFLNTGNLALYDMDYNNLYAPDYVGYHGGNISTMTDWQNTIANDIHSVRILPDFVDSSINLDIATHNDILSCPVEKVQTDIRGVIRSDITTIGAYIQPPVGLDLMLVQVSPWNTTVSNDQTIPINVDVLNMGAVPVTEATFGWSLNNMPKTSVSWTANPPLTSLEQRNIPIDVFPAINADTFHLKVWVESINTQPDTLNWNDTVSATSVIVPLAEFIAPATDTVYSLSFDVQAIIRTGTGAPAISPKLYLETIVNGQTSLYDSVPMSINNSVWQANIPQQYYGNKVIYSMIVSDTMGNTVTAKDSVYIEFLELGKVDTVVIGQSTTASYYTPLSMYNNYSWTRQIYLYQEICPDFSPDGITITKIAWQSQTATATYIDETCYMRVIDHAVQVSGYIYPLVNGASQVWTGVLFIQPGWVEITLDTPFFLPAGKNLEIFWQHLSTFSAGASHTWAHTPTQNSMTIYAQSNSSLPTTIAGTLNNNRPNIKITKRTPNELYLGNNLALMSFLSPINSIGNLCTPDYLPVTVILSNLGRTDYDFSKDSIVLRLEVTDPQQTKYSTSLSVNTGFLQSRQSDMIELISALPLPYSGTYELKAWIENSLDNVIYDDTIFYSYISERISLPIDDDFSNATLSSMFIATPVVGSDIWEPYNDPTSAVKPNSGTGMLRYVGTHGAMTQLLTRQLDLKESVNPKLDFWYYHDTSASDLDNSYTDVNLIVDGVSLNLVSLFRKGTVHGWEQYTFDINSYTGAQCVLVEFLSMNKYGAQSAQYIDRIIITSTPDVAVSEILISPEISACDLMNKSISVVLSTTVNQGIHFSDYNTSLAVELGAQTFTVPLQNVMSGNSLDTIFITSNIDLTHGVYTFRAYLTTPVDDFPLNDTASFLIDMQPSLSVIINPVTTVNSRIKIGDEVWQEVIIENTGNVELSGIELILRITGTNQNIVREALPVNLASGASYTHTFINSYIVPEDERYQVSLIAYVSCDSVNVNTGHAIDEYVDLHNLSLISIDNPPAGQPDTVSTAIRISVTLTNRDDINSFKNVSIYATVETEEGQPQITRLGTIEEILPLETQQFTFGESYTVPEDSIYRIRVYLGKTDNYPEDDTTETVRRTISRNVSIKGTDVSNVFALGQNVPNPANSITRIDYSIPKAGEVIFYIHSISGQLLYSKTIEAASGKQTLELNTSVFAAGIYFYSIEYKDQRLIKRMMISGQIND